MKLRKIRVNIKDLQKNIDETDLTLAKETPQFSRKNLDIALNLKDKPSVEKAALAKNLYHIAQELLKEDFALAFYLNALAKEAFEELIWKEENEQWELALAACYFQTAVMYGRLENDELEIEYYLKSLEALEQIPDCEHNFSALGFRSAINNNLASLYAKLDHMDKRMEAAFSALEDFRRLDDLFPSFESSISLVISTFNTATTLYLIEQYEPALKLVKESLERNENLNARKDLPFLFPLKAFALDLIASIYFKKSQFEKSLEYRKKAISLFEELIEFEHDDQMKEPLAKAFKKAARACSRLSLPADEIKYLKKHLKALQQLCKQDDCLENLEQLAKAYESVAGFYQEFDMKELAESYLDKAKSLNKKILEPLTPDPLN